MTKTISKMSMDDLRNLEKNISKLSMEELEAVIARKQELQKIKREAFKEIAEELFKTLTKEKTDKIYYLKDRWSEEKDYEDFNDYKPIIEKVFEDTDFEFIKITKAFKATLKHKTSNIKLAITFNWKGMKVKQL